MNTVNPTSALSDLPPMLTPEQVQAYRDYYDSNAQHHADLRNITLLSLCSTPEDLARITGASNPTDLRRTATLLRGWARNLQCLANYASWVGLLLDEQADRAAIASLEEQLSTLPDLPPATPSPGQH